MNRSRFAGLVVLLSLIPSTPALAHGVTATITPLPGPRPAPR